MNGLHAFKLLLLLQIIFWYFQFTCLLNPNQQQGGLYGNEKNFIDRR